MKHVNKFITGLTLAATLGSASAMKRNNEFENNDKQEEDKKFKHTGLSIILKNSLTNSKKLETLCKEKQNEKEINIPKLLDQHQDFSDWFRNQNAYKRDLIEKTLLDYLTRLNRQQLRQLDLDLAKKMMSLTQGDLTKMQAQSNGILSAAVELAMLIHNQLQNINIGICNQIIRACCHPYSNILKRLIGMFKSQITQHGATQFFAWAIRGNCTNNVSILLEEFGSIIDLELLRKISSDTDINNDIIKLIKKEVVKQTDKTKQ